MLLPIVAYPSIVTANLAHFGAVFSTPQLAHFQRYLTGLLVADNVTVTGINSLFVEQKDQSALNRFCTESPWSLTALNEARIRLMRQKLLPAQSGRGCLVIDDTLAHKTGTQMPGVGKFFDHSEGHYTLAQDVLTTFLVKDHCHFPVDLALYYQFQAKKELARIRTEAETTWQQGNLAVLQQYLVDLLAYHSRQVRFRTKLVMAQELFDLALQRQLPFDVVLFDSWFLDKTLVAHIEKKGKAWIGGCKPNRVITVAHERLHVETFCRRLPKEAYHAVTVGTGVYWAFTKVVPMSQLGPVRLLVSFNNPGLRGDPRYLVTRQLHWNATPILNEYDKRRQTEPFYRDEKQHFGFEGCQLRDEQGTIRHWYLDFLAYSLCQLEIALTRVGKGAKASPKTVGDCCRQANDELVGALVHWIIQRVEQGENAETILQRLLAHL